MRDTLCSLTHFFFFSLFDSGNLQIVDAESLIVYRAQRAVVCITSTPIYSISLSTVVFQSGGNAMVNGTAEMARMSPPPARFATAVLASFSAMMETVPVHTSFVTATRTALMAQMKMMCFVVRLTIYVLLKASSGFIYSKFVILNNFLQAIQLLKEINYDLFLQDDTVSCDLNEMSVICFSRNNTERRYRNSFFRYYLITNDVLNWPKLLKRNT